MSTEYLDSKMFYFDGIALTAPEEIVNTFPDEYTYNTFPARYCGPEDSPLALIIPEYFLGFTRNKLWPFSNFSIKLTPACYIHDKDWELSPPTEEGFLMANRRFLNNIMAIIYEKSPNQIVQSLALYRAVTYRNAVHLHGKSVFWKLKKEQGHTIPEKFNKYL